jgi:hypothetical protein
MQNVVDLRILWLVLRFDGFHSLGLVRPLVFLTIICFCNHTLALAGFIRTLCICEQLSSLQRGLMMEYF